MPRSTGMMKRKGVALVAVAVLAIGIAIGLWYRARRVQPAAGHPWLAGITSETRQSRPNVLLVVYDARRRDDFSFGPFGNSRHDTPFLASLAKDAVLFEDAVAPGCWTIPVHASIFSGQSVCDLGIDRYNRGFAVLDDGFLSLAEILHDAGYQTAAFPDHPYFYSGHPGSSLIRGFEQYSVTNDFVNYASRSNMANPGGPSTLTPQLGPFRHMDSEEFDQQVAAFNEGRFDFSLDGEGDHDPATGLEFARLGPLFERSPYFSRRYQRDLDAHVFAGSQERPYFLFVNLHMCCVAMPDPELFERWYLRTLMLSARRAGRKLPEGSKGDPILDRLETLHARLGFPTGPLPTPLGFMKHVFDNRFYDASFQAVWSYLERRGKLENTVAVVTSDHGLGFGEQGEPIYLHGGARPHEYLVRVPLVVRFPEGSPYRRLHGRHRQLVSLTDLFTTITDLALGPGVFSRDRPIRGRSLMSRLDTGQFDDVIVSECSAGPYPYEFLPGTACHAKAVYAGRYKLMYGSPLFAVAGEWPFPLRLEAPWPGPAASAPRRERLDRPFARLYDIAKDPEEKTDLAASEPDRVESMRNLVMRWECDPGLLVDETPIWDAEAIETLRALGYVQ